ncbi:MAG TPA: multidrug effflux MFS transporter [Candidatus Krumholzibacteria bacterium]|nr:multidrug effflux MFS transporter [Candidatus Krumholzibacteria bacterium]
MALMTSLVALSIDGMLPALAPIGRDLGANAGNQTQWVVTALLIGLALGQLVYGPLSDSTGRKGPVHVGLVIFAVGCLLCVVAGDFRAMLVGRLLQGLGAAGPRSVSIALIRDLHAGREMAKIMSLIMSVFILVPIAAPAVGELILLIVDWRGIFGFFLLLSLLVLFWFALRQPETLPRERRKPFTIRKLGRTLATVLRDRAAIGFTLTSGISSGAFIGYLSSAQQIFQDVYQVGSRFALHFAILAASIGLAALLNGRLVMRLGMIRLSTWALRSICILSAAFLLASFGLPGKLGLLWFMVYMILTFFCVGILFGNMNALAMDTLGEIAGVGAAVVASVSLSVSIVLGAIIGQSFNGTVIPLVGGFALLSLASLPLIAWADRGRITHHR